MFAMISSFVCDYCHFGVDKCFRTNYILSLVRGDIMERRANALKAQTR